MECIDDKWNETTFLCFEIFPISRYFFLTSKSGSDIPRELVLDNGPVKQGFWGRKSGINPLNDSFACLENQIENQLSFYMGAIARGTNPVAWAQKSTHLSIL